jgi:hypothetical protein
MFVDLEAIFIDGWIDFQKMRVVQEYKFFMEILSLLVDDSLKVLSTPLFEKFITVA